jgi:hypothetical protein
MAGCAVEHTDNRERATPCLLASRRETRSQAAAAKALKLASSELLLGMAEQEGCDDCWCKRRRRAVTL